MNIDEHTLLYIFVYLTIVFYILMIEKNDTVYLEIIVLCSN